MRLQEFTREEVLEVFETVFASEKKQGIIGYRVINPDTGRYFRFNGKPSHETIEFVEYFNSAYIFKSRINAMPILLELEEDFELLPIVTKEF